MAGRALRFRRLISFLRHRRLYATARTLGTETRVFFDAAHLCRMIRHDRWAAASSYVLRFLNLRDCTREAGMLHRYIVVFRVIADLAAGHTLTLTPAVDALFQQLYDSLLAQPYSHITRRVVLSWRSDHTKASRLYHNTKPNAVDAVMNLVANCPELKPKCHWCHNYICILLVAGYGDVRPIIRVNMAACRHMPLLLPFFERGLL